MVCDEDVCLHALSPNVHHLPLLFIYAVLGNPVLKMYALFPIHYPQPPVSQLCNERYFASFPENVSGRKRHSTLKKAFLESRDVPAHRSCSIVFCDFPAVGTNLPACVDVPIDRSIDQSDVF